VNRGVDLGGRRIIKKKKNNVVLTLCRRKIDKNMLGRVLDVGLVADGRLARFTVSVVDRPGGLARLTAVIAEAGASIHELAHDRAFSGPNVSEVRVVCVVETTGPEHVRTLHEKLASAGFRVTG
jgi:threonine dehydratase